MKITPLLLTLILTYNAYCQQGLIADSIEYKSLSELYYATNGDGWYNNSGWLQDPDISKWHGVFLENGDVTKIDLSINDLAGQIPGSFYDLTGLREVWLGFNDLEGELSGSISELVNLEILELRVNQFKGRIPAAIGDLQNLYFLDLSSNNFDGLLPNSLWNLTNLLELNLSFNSFQGTLPMEMANLRNLKLLHLESNLFEGKIPASIGLMTSLEDIYLGYNLFEGELPESLGLLQNLIGIDIVGTPFEGSLPPLKDCTSLFNVYFSASKISSLGNFNENPRLYDIGIYADEMSLDFGDLEPYFNLDGSKKPYFFFYSPQDSVNTYFSSPDFTYSVEVGGQYNQYQWLKNGIDIPGATTKILPLDGSIYDESDIYQCRITNTLVTDLTLWSKAETIPSGQFYAISGGNWHSPIWSREKNGPLTDELPGERSEVFIIGQDVTLSQNATTGPIRVIVENAGASLTVDGAEMRIIGDLELVKETEGYPGNVKVINGGRIVPEE